MSFDVAMKALVADSDRWHAMSQELATMSANTTGLALDASAFSFAGGAAHTAYEHVRSFVQHYLSDGSTKVQGASDVLDYVHATYAGTDEAAKAALGAEWAWL